MLLNLSCFKYNKGFSGIQIVYTLSTYKNFWILRISILCGFIQNGYSENVNAICGCLGERRVFIYMDIQHRLVKVVLVVSVNLIRFFQRATRIWILTRMAIYYKGVRPYIYTIYTGLLPAPLLGTIPKTHSHPHPHTCFP
jgi:hypothetical protein